jgi:hypothetical protein
VKADWIHHINRRDFFDHLGKELSFQTLDDFYNTTVDDVKSHGGAALLHTCYGNSLHRAVQDVYIHYKWLPWKFSQNVKEGFWDSIDNQRSFLDWLGNEAGFKAMSDWLKITGKYIIKMGGSGLLDKYEHSLPKLLRSVYSGYH